MRGDRAERLKVRRAALQKQLAARRRATPKPERRRRQWLPWGISAVLLLLLLRECQHTCPEPIDVPCICDEPTGEPVVVEPVPADPVLHGRVPRTARTDYRSGRPKPLSWIAAFRLQVAARSTRLSACFEGVARPGTFKWTTSVEPVEGRTSEHTLEPMIDTDGLTSGQRSCVLGVLTAPDYDLVTGDEPATPSRVSLIVEF